MLLNRSIWIVPLCFLLKSAGAEISFVEVSEDVGIYYSGQSYGSSWGDANGDGRPDLWVGNHGAAPTLYINQADGTFAVAQLSIPAGLPGDMHGASWADYDADGDQDLLVLVGAQSGTGTGPNILLENIDAAFSDRSVELGIDYPLGRGRTPMWFDWNKDGRLDAVVTTSVRSDGQAPSAIFTQTASGFVLESQGWQFLNGNSNLFVQLADLAPDMSPPYLSLHERFSFPSNFLSYQMSPFADITQSFWLAGKFRNTRDVAYADFDGDGLDDAFLFVADDLSTVVQVGQFDLHAYLSVDGDEKTIVIPASPDVTLTFSPEWKIAIEEIFIGTEGQHPPDIAFDVSATDPTSWGVFPHEPGVDEGVYIGYVAEEAAWRISQSGHRNLNSTITSTLPLAGFGTEGFTPESGALQDSLVLVGVSGQPDAAASFGLGDPRPCETGVAGDFDNDTDIDLYFVCQDTVQNLPNQLYENTGGGNFQSVALAGGAEGTQAGRGESVSVADFDLDGYLDIFVANGRGNVPFDDGPYQLFRNTSIGNHWLEVDLEGVVSNPHGIGARIRVESGSVVQKRLVDGGMHRFSQNHMRVHFGLGSATSINRVIIDWPSGIEQIEYGIPIDQVVVITEAVVTDTDGDGVGDDVDNCTLVANPDQCDSNADGFGNLCDADLNNNAIVNFSDLGLFKAAFLSSPQDPNWDADADLNCNDVVNFSDLAIMKDLFLQAPGPGGGQAGN